MEEQQSESLQQQTSQDERDKKARVKADTQRKIQALKLNRARIREQMERSTNERYRELLKKELEHLEHELTQLDS